MCNPASPTKEAGCQTWHAAVADESQAEARGGVSFAVGDKVRLKARRHGEPGAVLRIERRKLVIYWRDLDFIGRHLPESLVLVERATNSAAAPPELGRIPVMPAIPPDHRKHGEHERPFADRSGGE